MDNLKHKIYYFESNENINLNWDMKLAPKNDFIELSLKIILNCVKLLLNFFLLKGKGCCSYEEV